MLFVKRRDDRKWPWIFFPFPIEFIYAQHWFFFLHFHSILTYCWSTMVTTLIITLGIFIGTQLSANYPRNVEIPVTWTTCTCDCWDGFLRGVHSRGGYKTFYINYALQTIILIGLFLFYAELLRHFLVQTVVNKRPAIYSNYCGIWAIINYLNDHDYHRMLPSQLFFSITELIANYIFYRCLLRTKTNASIPRWCIYLVATICSVHTLLSAKELNIQWIHRNMGILAPDLISLLCGYQFVFMEIINSV